jgi:hypothetical protein
MIVNGGRAPSEQSIAEPLMVTFRMIMLQEFRYRTTQRRWPNEYYPVQARFFDCANEAPGMGIPIR